MNVKALVAKKIGMTRMMDPEGHMVAVTLLQIEEQKITKILTPGRDGYSAVQVGYFTKRDTRLTKADHARLRKVNVAENFARFKEFRSEKPVEGIEAGASLTAAILEGVKAVDVTGFTKGRGFTGSVKRWSVACGRMTHGSRFHRRPGSLGTRTTPGRVFKGKPQPGQYGDEQRTIQNLRLLDVDTKNNVIAVYGSVPGHQNNYLFVKPSIKA